VVGFDLDEGTPADGVTAVFSDRVRVVVEALTSEGR